MNRQNFQGQSRGLLGREIWTWLIGLLIFIFISLFFSGIIPLFAWTEPTEAPPGGNVSAPINVSDIYQTKYGALHIVGDSSDYKGFGLGKSTLSLSSGQNLIYGRIDSNSSPNSNFLLFKNCVDQCCTCQATTVFQVTSQGGVLVGEPTPAPVPAFGDLNAQRLCIQGDCRSEWPSGGGTPGGSNTQVQFNDNGSFGGDAGFTYNKTTDRATIGALTVDTNTLYVDSTNHRVGIGMTVPGYKLSLRSDNPTTALPIINVWNDGGVIDWTGLRLARGGTNDGDEKWFIGMNDADNQLRFRRNGANDDMILDTSGNLNLSGNLNVLDPGLVSCANTKTCIKANGRKQTALVASIAYDGPGGFLVQYAGYFVGPVSIDNYNYYNFGQPVLNQPALEVLGNTNISGSLETDTLIVNNNLSVPNNQWQPAGCEMQFQPPPCPPGRYVVNVDFATQQVACCEL
jgi:hypothetical protein